MLSPETLRWPFIFVGVMFASNAMSSILNSATLARLVDEVAAVSQRQAVLPVQIAHCFALNEKTQKWDRLRQPAGFVLPDETKEAN